MSKIVDLETERERKKHWPTAKAQVNLQIAICELSLCIKNNAEIADILQRWVDNLRREDFGANLDPLTIYLIDPEDPEDPKCA